jgi:N utilization substance protein B
MTIKRRQAREWAVQMLTAADLNPPEDVGEFIASHRLQLPTLEESEGAVELKGKLMEFAESLVKGVLGSIDEIDAILTPLLDNWDVYRLGTVERAVLRLGVWELKACDTPVPVVINEAIDLVNWYSSPKSRTLVNGVLDRYAKSVR